jgi:hypothetical protein
MEGYAAGKPAASADAGLAVLVGELAGAGAARSFDEIEQLVMVRGRELLRKVTQYAVDAGAAAEPRLAGVADAAGVPRPRAERGHARAMISQFGPVVIERMAYRAPGQPNLYPRDAVLNLPPRRYSWQVQRMVVGYVLAGAYEQAQRFAAAATGVVIGKQQLEQITAGAAADAAGFYSALARDQGQEEPGLPPGPLLISADCKGVAMLPGSCRRRGARPPAQRVRNFEKRRGTGEKGYKRMAQTRCVFDVAPVPRTPEQVMASGPGKHAPRALRRWYIADIAADRAETIRAAFDEAERRDPRHERTWVALIDGDNHQIEMIRAQAAQRGVTITILIDLIHVLEYLWKAAWCFHAPPRPRDRGLGHRPGAGHPARPRRPGHRADQAASRPAPAQARQRARQDHPQDPDLPRRQGTVPGLPRRAGGRLADRHRRHRGRLPPPHRRPDGHHRSQVEHRRRPGHLVAARHPRQRRPGHLLELAHPARTPAQPPQPLPARPRTRRITLTGEKPHPCCMPAVAARAAGGQRGCEVGRVSGGDCQCWPRPTRDLLGDRGAAGPEGQGRCLGLGGFPAPGGASAAVNRRSQRAQPGHVAAPASLLALASSH